MRIEYEREERAREKGKKVEFMETKKMGLGLVAKMT